MNVLKFRTCSKPKPKLLARIFEFLELGNVLWLQGRGRIKTRINTFIDRCKEIDESEWERINRVLQSANNAATNKIRKKSKIS